VIAFYSEIRAIENNEHRTCGGEADGAAAGLALILAYFLPRPSPLCDDARTPAHAPFSIEYDTTGQAARARTMGTHTYALLMRR